MGLIKSAFTAAGTELADQWREFFTVDAMQNSVLIQRGVSRKSGSNTKGSPGVISNGSVISVPDGTAMMIIDNGAVVEFTAEAGQYTFDHSTEPSCFYGGFGKGLMESFARAKQRFTFGGDTARDQRVYYVNTKEILDNKFGTPTPLSYADPQYRNIYIRCFGMYTFKVSDPIVFYEHIAGNVADVYTAQQLTTQCTAEFMTALDVALNACGNDGIVFSRLPQEQLRLSKHMADALDEDWKEKRGITIENVALEVSPDEESRKRIQVIDDGMMMSNPGVGAGVLLGAQAQAMKDAASNPNGAMSGVLGVGMLNNLFNNNGGQSPLAYMNQNQPAPGSWKCACGTANTGKFCGSCGKPKPAAAKCLSCGKEIANAGTKFCDECGAKIG